MSKYYFINPEDELCYTKDYILDYMLENDIKHLEVHEAVPIIGHDMGWCQEHVTIIDKGEGFCGKGCQFYNPRNGKSGICSSLGRTYERGNKVKMEIKLAVCQK